MVGLLGFFDASYLEILLHICGVDGGFSYTHTHTLINKSHTMQLFAKCVCVCE